MKIVNRGDKIFARRWNQWYVWHDTEFVKINFVARADVLGKVKLYFEDLKTKVKKYSI